MAEPEPREQLTAIVARMLEKVREITYPDVYARAAVAAIEREAGDGWLIIDGKVRRVTIADRFGPSSWEITADELPGDRDSWAGGGVGA